VGNFEHEALYLAKFRPGQLVDALHAPRVTALAGHGYVSSRESLLDSALTFDMRAEPNRDRDRLLGATVLIVDDNTLYRQNLAAALAASLDSAPHVAWDTVSLLSCLEQCPPDVVLLSMATTDAAALLQSVSRSRPEAKVIAVGVWEGDEQTIIACAEAGVTGYHLRDESFDDLVSLMKKIAAGESMCSPKVAAVLLRRLSSLAAERKPDTGDLVLTAREVQILRMLELGLSNREIADRLCIALHTVKNHVHSILGKLGVRTRGQAVALSRSINVSE
jgi:DNA-binding NarL/FixJ family response regulator